jgi:uncharacterized RDD family membrane protein YckC
MSEWYYKQGDQKCGPLIESDLVELIETGVLHTDTLVWTRELSRWTVASDVTGLFASASKPPLLSNALPPRSFLDAPDYTISGNQCRPWVRVFARAMDFLLYIILLQVVFASANELVLYILVCTFVFLLTYLFVEPAMLVAWGSTPGKFLFGVRVRNSDGSKLSYAKALSRTYKVVFRGIACGLGIFALFYLIRSYSRLMKEGITSWDEDGEIEVSHQIIGLWRTIVIILIFIAIIFVIMQTTPQYEMCLWTFAHYAALARA